MVKLVDQLDDDHLLRLWKTGGLIKAHQSSDDNVDDVSVAKCSESMLTCMWFCM